MLGKLLKHEFIATGRIMGVVYAVAALAMSYILGSYYFSKETASPGQIIGIFVLMLISFCSFILTTVIMVTNFQKSLYGDQGYLSFTLPVKGSSLLVSKIITSTVWYIAAFACFMGTMVISFTVLKNDLVGEENYDMIQSLLPMFLGGKTLASIITLVIVDLVKIFIEFAVVTLALYFAISLANTRLFQKRYVLWTIIFVIASFIIIGNISTFIEQRLSFGIAINGSSLSLVTGETAETFVSLSGLLIYIVFGIGLYFATFWLMNKKVNIK